MAKRKRKRSGVSRHPGVALLRPNNRRQCFVIRWTDPDGTRRQESTGYESESFARQYAVDKAAKLASGERDDVDISWVDFCNRYEREHLALGAARSLAAWGTPRNWITKLANPAFLSDIASASAISRFTAKLREALEEDNQRARESTVASYLKHIQAALNWAEEIGLLKDKVRIKMPRRAKGQSKLARSRPITLEEFERIVDAVPKVRKKDAAQWQRFLWGLWEDGFRLSEHAQLSWDPDAAVSIDESGPIPMVRILASGEKGATDRMQPITPEFWRICCQTPESERSGLVFPLIGRKGPAKGRQISTEWIGRVISKIGRKALVKTGFGSDKTATSHDIGKRSLTTRLGGKLTQNELAEWMRHQSPETTKRYYYMPTAENLARRVWSPQGDELGDEGPPEPEEGQNQGS